MPGLGTGIFILITNLQSETHKSSGGSTRELAMKYFSELSLETVEKLYEVYKVDFEMFGYSPQLYYEYSHQ